MGVNELSSDENAEQSSETTSTITERDQNVQRDASDRKHSESEDEKHTSRNNKSDSSEINEETLVVDKPQIEGDSSQELKADPQMMIGEADLLKNDVLSADSAAKEAEENSNTLGDAIDDSPQINSIDTEPTHSSNSTPANTKDEVSNLSEQTIPTSEPKVESVRLEKEACAQLSEADIHKRKLKKLFNGCETILARLEMEKSNSNDSLNDSMDSCKATFEEEDNSYESLEFSTNILSYERFFPGRILGNTFIVRNIGTKTIKFTVQFDNSDIDRMLVGEKLCEYYGCDSVNEIEDSYTKHIIDDIDVSENSIKPWNVEDPYTKKLAKSVHMELEPAEEYEFIVVLKSPVMNKQNLFAMNVAVHNTTQDSVHKIFCFGCMETLKVS